MGRDDRIQREAAALWCELFQEPPPERADGTAMLDLIMKRMPHTGYDRIRTPHLRPTNITMPSRAQA